MPKRFLSTANFQVLLWVFVIVCALSETLRTFGMRLCSRTKQEGGYHHIATAHFREVRSKEKIISLFYEYLYIYIYVCEIFYIDIIKDSKHIPTDRDSF
jgi:hypothetical protein